MIGKVFQPRPSLDAEANDVEHDEAVQQHPKLRWIQNEMLAAYAVVNGGPEGTCYSPANSQTIVGENVTKNECDRLSGGDFTWVENSHNGG